MTIAELNDEVAGLQEAANRALRAGDPRGAVEHFQRAVALAPQRLDLWMGLAASQRAIGATVAALNAVNGALEREPRFFPALLMKGSLLDAMGRTAEAAKMYGVVVQLAPPAAELNRIDPARPGARRRGPPRLQPLADRGPR